MRSFKKLLALLMVISVFTGSSASVQASSTEQTVVNMAELKAALEDVTCTKVIIAGTDFLINEDIMVFEDKAIELQCPVTVDGKNTVMLFGTSIINKSTLTNNGSLKVYVGSITNETGGNLVNNGNLQRVDDIQDNGAEGSLNRCAAIPEPTAESTGYVGIVADCATMEGLMYAMSSPDYNEIWVSQIHDSGDNREIGIDLTVTGDLTVSRPTYIYGNDTLRVNGDLTIAPVSETEYGYLYLEGTAEVQGNLINNGEMLVAGGLTVAGNLSNYGHMTKAETGRINVTGALQDLEEGTHSNEYGVYSQDDWNSALADSACSLIRIASSTTINITSDTQIKCNLLVEGELNINLGYFLLWEPGNDDTYFGPKNFISGQVNNEGTLILETPVEVGNQLNNSNKIVISRDAGIGLSFVENDGNIGTFAHLTNSGEIENHGFIDRFAPDEISENIVISNTGAIWGDGYCYFDYAHLVTHWLDNYGSGWFEHTENNYYDNQIGVTPGEHRVIFYLYRQEAVSSDWVYTPVTLTSDYLSAIPSDEISTNESEDTTNGAHYTTLNISDWNSLLLEYNDGGVTYKFPVNVGLPEMGFYSTPEANTENYISKFIYTPDSRKFYAIATVFEGFSIVGAECSEDAFTVTQNGNVFELELPAGIGGEYNLNFRVTMQSDEDSNNSHTIDNWIWVHEGEYEGLVLNWTDWKNGNNEEYNFRYPVLSKDGENNFKYDSSAHVYIGGATWGVFYRYNNSGTWTYVPVDSSQLSVDGSSGISVSEWYDPNSGPIADSEYTDCKFTQLDFSKCGSFEIFYTIGGKTFALPVNVSLPGIGAYSAPNASEAALLSAVDFSARKVFYIVPTINMDDADISQTEFLINGSDPYEDFMTIQETGEDGFEYWTAQIIASPFANDFNLRVVIRNANREEIASRDIWFYSEVDDTGGNPVFGGVLSTPDAGNDTSMQIDVLGQNYAGYFSFTPGTLTDQVYLFGLSGTSEGSIMYIFDENWNLEETGYLQNLSQSDSYLSSGTLTPGNTYYIAFINKGGNAAGFTLSASVENIPQQPDSIVWTEDWRGMSGLLITGDIGQKCVIYVKIDGRWHERAGLRDIDTNNGTCFFPAAEILDNGETASEFAAAISENNIKSAMLQLIPGALTDVSRNDSSGAGSDIKFNYYPDNQEAVITVVSGTFIEGMLYRLQHRTSEGWWDYNVEFIGDGTSTAEGRGWGELSPGGNYVLTEYIQSETEGSFIVGYRTLTDTESNVGSVQFNEVTTWLAGGLQSPTQDSPGMRRFYQPIKYGRSNFWMVDYNTETHAYTFGELLGIEDLDCSDGMRLSEEEGQLALEFTSWGDYTISYTDELSREHIVTIDVRMNEIDFYSGTAPSAANVFPGSITSINRKFYLIWSQNAEKNKDVDSVEYEIYEFYGKIDAGESVEGYYYREENPRQYLPANGVSDGTLDFFTREDAAVSADLTNITGNIAEFNLETDVDNDMDIIAYLKSGDDVVGTIDKRINVFGNMWQANFRTLSIWVMNEYSVYMFGVADSEDATQMDAISQIMLEGDGQMRGTFTGLTCDTTYYLYYSTDYDGLTGEGTWVPASGISEMTSGHNFSPEWTKDETSHWHACECGGEADKEAHTWDEGAVTAPAACEAAGVKDYTCTVCGGTKTESVAALGHNWGAWQNLDATNHKRICANDQTHTETAVHTWDAGVVTTPATCETAGSRTYTCTVCGGTKTEAIAAVGHDWGSWIPISININTPDYAVNHQRICSRDNNHIEKATHVWSSPVVIAPTCTQEGYTLHTCSVCGYFYSDTPTSRLEHDYGSCIMVDNETHKRVCSYDASHIETDIHWMNTEIIEPTCTEAGYTRHYCMENCGYSYNDTYTEAHGHSYPFGWTADDAITHSKQCLYQDCSNIITENHAFRLIQDVPGNLNMAGLKSFYCDACGYQVDVAMGPYLQWSFWTSKNDSVHSRYNISDPTETQEAEHVWGATTLITEPTCTEAGYTTHYCRVCDYSYADAPNAALGHDWGSWTSIDDDAVHQRVCSRDGSHIENQAHTWNAGVVTTPATCTEAGVKTYSCTVCSDTKTEAIAALGHNYGAWQYVDAANHRRVCANDQTHTETEAHTWNAGVVTTPATCIEDGVRTYTCTVCGGTKTEAIAAIGHNYGAWQYLDVANHRRVCENDQTHTESEAHTLDAGVVTTPATCTEAGVKTYSCIVCGGTKTEAITALGHNYGAWQYLDAANHRRVCANDQTHTETEAHTWDAGVVTTPATCETTGVRTYTCIVCSDTKTEAIAAIGHNYGAWQYLDAANHRRVCANDQTHTESEAHTWDAGVVTTPATCTEAGVKTYSCTVCGGTKTEAITALGHNYGAWQYVDAANHRRVCANDQTHSESEAHTLNAGVVTTPETCTEAGIRTYTCTVCSGTKTEAVAALGHDFGSWTSVNPTTHQRVCSHDASHIEESPHTFGTGIVTAPSCIVAGYTTHTCTVCGFSFSDTPTAALGHDFGSWTSVNPTTHQRVCSHDASHIETAAHTWGVPSETAPTCTAAGYTRHTCTVCGYTYTDSPTAALGHRYSSSITKAPTCTESGVMASVCSVDGVSYTQLIPPLGHNWGEWVVKTEPTLTSDGIRERTCTNDSSHKETETIPKLVKPSIDIQPSGGVNGINAGVTIMGNTALLNVDPDDMEALEQETSDGGTVTFDTSGLGTEIDNLTLSSSILSTISESGSNPDAGQAGTGVKVVLSAAEVEFDAGALQSLVQDAEEGENITIGAAVIENSTLTTEQQGVVGDAPVYDLSAIATNSNGETRKISNFDGTVTVRIPYVPKAGEDTNAIRIYYLNDAGVIESIACSYDPIGKYIVFTTNHFSYYFVKNDEVGKFRDVSLTDWFYGNVQYVLANNLMGGTSESSFKPHMATNRAMLVTVLYRLEGSPAVEGRDEFSDVSEGQWYTNAILWAANSGIVGGYGNGKFGPNDSLTREQMVTILWRYSKYKGYDVNTGENIVLSGYRDFGSTFAYAADAMRWGIGKGIIIGTGNSLLAPKGNAERCQLAAILQRFLDSIDKK